MRTVRAPYLENKVLPEQQQQLPADDHQLGFGFSFGLGLVGHSGPSCLQEGDGSRTVSPITALRGSQRKTLLEKCAFTVLLTRAPAHQGCERIRYAFLRILVHWRRK